jgi:hypothetical protein
VDRVLAPYKGVGLVNDVRPAAELVERMMREAHAILKRLGQSLA